VYDKRPYGKKGRVLANAIPELMLEAGDRLEPGPLLADVAAFEQLTPPFSVCFWRVSEETHARHRNPLFSSATGISLQTLGIDWLHTLSLGCFQSYLARLLWDLIMVNAWSVPGPPAAHAELSIVTLRSELWEWYSEESKQERHWTRVQGITVGMIGSNDDPSLKLHGSETNGFLNFAQVLLQKYGHKLAPDQLRMHNQALQSLLGIYDAIKDHPQGNFPAEQIQAFCGHVSRHLHALRALHVSFKPKHHSLMEMGSRFP
jgi:hypothetical protein